MNPVTFFSQPVNYIFVGFCLATAIQLFYYLFFFSRLAFFKSKKRTTTQTHPVSVIICAKDEEPNLKKYLPGALIQKYATTHEVIVVNDNSTDDTKYILEEYQRTFKHMQIIELKQKAHHIPGKKFPLSVGIKSAKHEVVLLTDADCLPASDKWIEKMQEKYDDGIDIVIGYSPFQRRKGLLNKLVRWEGYMTALQYFSYALCGIPYMGVGRNLSYKKSTFFKHKGFSSFNNLPGGDDDLFVNKAATNSNVAVSLEPETFTIARPPETWGQWKRQKERHYSTSKYYQKKHQVLLGLFAASLFLYYPLFVTSVFIFDWRIVTGIFLFRLLIQYFIIYKTSQKLNETDLTPWALFFDIWMFFYYLIFAGSLVKKPRKSWK